MESLTDTQDALSLVSRTSGRGSRRNPLVQVPTLRKRPHRAWLIPAVVGAILFVGGVAANLVAAYLQTSLDPYRRWVWVIFGIALMVAIAVAIREARRVTDPSALTGAAVDGDVVVRDK